MSKRSRLFQVYETQIEKILFCENSDSEDALQLDAEDINFLTADNDYAKENMKSGEVLECTIDLSTDPHSNFTPKPNLPDIPLVEPNLVLPQPLTSSTFNPNLLNVFFSWSYLALETSTPPKL